ncbi:gp53-like domain-containing protein [Photorhabdus stackebrandtii]|uniref:gp53-like domain-containing protein n=1 Tax=Photorhabdus stackebrandtii TaxID=1123042 RepID=UPI001F62338B|nr:hypothetical protein [Photorhabdus stackebrandtii]
MSAKNDFKAFSISDNANVVSQERYEENKDLQTGFPPNNVPTHVLNKVLRQSSTISSVVANFIAEQSGDDVLDNGNVGTLTAQLDKALERKITTESDGRFIRLNTDTKTSGCILSKTANIYDDQSMRDLSLSGFLRPNGWADLGGLAIHIAHPSWGVQHSRGISFEYGSTSGGNQGFGIHTYAFDKDGKFKGKKRILTEDDNSKALLSVNGWWKCGNTGIIIQWGQANGSMNKNDYRNFVIPFPNACFQVVATYPSFDNYGFGVAALPVSASQFILTCRNAEKSLTNGLVRYLAIGY